LLEPTREVFGNITPLMQGVFFCLVILSVGSLGWHIWTRARLWWKGVSGEYEHDWRIWVSRLVNYGLAQKRVRKKTSGGILHACLSLGFLVLLLGTTLLFITDIIPGHLHRGAYYLGYEISLDIFGLIFCLGCVMALGRRIFARPVSLGHSPLDWLLLTLLLAIGVTGFFVEAFRLLHTQVDPEVAQWSIVGWSLSLLMSPYVEVGQASTSHQILWWVHAVLICGFFALIPFTRFLHVLTAPLNLALHPSRVMGALAPIHLDQVEETGQVGVGHVLHFTRQQLLSLDACMECGRCQDVCPAYEAKQPLSPKMLVSDLKGLMETSGLSRQGVLVPSETIGACTMCQACVSECPVHIKQVDLISDLRRYQVAEGKLTGAAAQTLRRLGKTSDPYGKPQSERMDWAAGLDVPTVESNPNFDCLFWVGCAAAYDSRTQKVARAIVQLFQKANINFAVLGKKEKCSGDPARRLGEEFLFQQLAQDNIGTLQRHKVRKVVTSCPHCFNTIKNEYPQFGGDFEVQHHSQFLSDLIESGALVPGENGGQSITLHDPCYLARVNGEVDAQRAVATAGGYKLQEMPRHGKNTFCCGAGGGRFWSDDEKSEQRVSHVRAGEALDTQADILATGCPFCLNMMDDGLRGLNKGRQMQTLDIAEVLLMSTDSEIGSVKPASKQL
jgi:Fe-S oxidoreductase/nitrate reductase gamma subunit